MANAVAKIKLEAATEFNGYSFSVKVYRGKRKKMKL